MSLTSTRSASATLGLEKAHHAQHISRFASTAGSASKNSPRWGRDHPVDLHVEPRCLQVTESLAVVGRLGRLRVVRPLLLSNETLVSKRWRLGFGLDVRSSIDEAPHQCVMRRSLCTVDEGTIPYDGMLCVLKRRLDGSMVSPA